MIVQMVVSLLASKDVEHRYAGLKHPHAVTYTVQAFMIGAAYMPAGEGAKWADRAQNWLNGVAWDATFGGYWGSYRASSERYEAGVRLPTPDGRDILGLVPGFKEINTQGDAVDTLTWLVRERGDTASIRRLTSLMDLIIGKLLQPTGVLPYRYWPDWQPAPDLIRVGYQFLMARHLCEAASLIDAPDVLKACQAMVDFCLASARHPEGGFSFAVSADGRSWPSISKSTDQRQWWVQFEAVRTLHLMARHESIDPTCRARYALERDALWLFVKLNFLDDEFGGVFGLPRPSGSLKRRLMQKLKLRDNALRKSHCWKDAIHETTTFLSLIESSEQH